MSIPLCLEYKKKCIFDIILGGPNLKKDRVDDLNDQDLINLMTQPNLTSHKPD